MAEWRDRDLAERRERLAGATGRRIRRRSTQTGGGPGVHAPERKTKATVTEPVRMKDFCAATGLNFIECFKVLRDEHDLIANVNMTIPSETAELLALHFGIELTVIPAKTKLDELQDEVAARERKHLQPRPPVVTMLGHVDHGKTSLLDAIRKTHVVATEDGGITQHIGAYHVISSHGPVTFLDTPGHEAFTAMRARGAELTDVVVLVVAADDGVMPQTVEAINHAKAADVPIVVALNKIDLGDQNKIKIYTQLTEHGLTPSGEWGGDVDVIPTSATTGQGVQELVDHLADLASLLELKADPTLPAVGTAIEAETKPGVGPVVRVLVQEGTLRVGDVVVCGPAAGKVRALLNDRGERIREAGPAIPVEVWGLDDVPMAGDRLYVVENMKRAKDIATETKQDRLEKARAQSRKVRTLEEMLKRRDAEDVPELNVIIKADVDGSVAALKQSLGDFPTDEVKLTIRHAGVGAVTDSDVDLAAACDGIILAFRVDAPAGVRRLAEHHGVDIRTYRVIYDVCDDVKKALEGMLAPEEVLETRGTAEVRELFRMSKKVGLVAGCYVTDGVVNRNHLVKIVRDGVVVREGCAIASLRRFKDDVKEVRAGLECGIKLDGFDDLHVGDVLEAYEIVQVARTL
ncbi:MAG: translation initiation factor IF-2 [Planctomycetota bacterium]|nr:MAG: translation initiation factor IF-2 [Planctomycetota bacterium]